MAARKILIALDGKKHADYALSWYLDNFHKAGDTVVIFHCSNFHLNVNLPGAAVNVEHVSRQVEKAKADSDKITQAAAQILKNQGVKYYTVCKHHGKPDEAILETLDQEEVHHVIMGTRDLGPIKRTLIGSVSTQVVRNAKVPVTIVKNYADKH